MNEQQTFNIALLAPHQRDLKNMAPITSLDRTEGSSRNFHPNGLFSTQIFGPQGNELRARRFGYIYLKVEIFHPMIFKALVGLKALYGDIMASKAYAKWDNVAKDFVKASAADGETGFHFFFQHVYDIKYEDRPSVARRENITLITRDPSKISFDSVIVMPAGMRDIEIDASGRESDNEINEYYRRLIALSNTVTESAVKNNPEILNPTRYSMQLAFNALFDYLKSGVDGKKKLILGKFASRAVFNGTRNVITAVNAQIQDLEDFNNIGCNDTVVGLFQTLKAILPISIFHLKTGFLANVFPGMGLPVNLVNKKTLKKESVTLDPSYFEQWMTDEGLEKVISHFEVESMRHR